MQSKRKCNCKDQVVNAKTFVKNLKKRNKFSKKQRDTFSVVILI